MRVVSSPGTNVCAGAKFWTRKSPAQVQEVLVLCTPASSVLVRASTTSKPSRLGKRGCGQGHGGATHGRAGRGDAAVADAEPLAVGMETPAVADAEPSAVGAEGARRL